jgi:hypothetical protein
MNHPPIRDRRRPVDGDNYELRDRMSGRVPVQQYLTVLNALLRRADDDLAALSVGRLSDTVRESAARKEVHDHLQATRAALVDALGHVQHITDPRLQFTLGVIGVGPALTSAGLVLPAEEVAWTRHARGRWGTATTDERAANELAVRVGVGRILSRHQVGGIDVVIVTESDRSMTQIMRADRY